MATFLTDEGERLLLEVFVTGDTARPSTLYIGLANDTPAETDGLADLQDEPSENGYARQAVTTASGVITLNSGDYQVTLPTATFVASGGTIGPVTHAFAATTADDSGLLVYVWEISDATVTTTGIADGQSFEFTGVLKAQ